jgi:hypothetical protein
VGPAACHLFSLLFSLHALGALTRVVGAARRSDRPLYVLFCAKYRGGSVFRGSDRVPAAGYFPLYLLTWTHTGCFCVSGATSLSTVYWNESSPFTANHLFLSHAHTPFHVIHAYLYLYLIFKSQNFCGVFVSASFFHPPMPRHESNLKTDSVLLLPHGTTGGNQ